MALGALGGTRVIPELAPSAASSAAAASSARTTTSAASGGAGALRAPLVVVVAEGAAAADDAKNKPGHWDQRPPFVGPIGPYCGALILL